MTESAAANLELLQEHVASLLVQPPEAASVVLASGPRIFDTASPLRIPKLTSGATVGFIGEGGPNLARRRFACSAATHVAEINLPM